MGMADVLFKSAGPFQQIVNILSTDGSLWNLTKDCLSGFREEDA